MATLLKNRLAYLSASFILFLLALPLISVGSTRGPRALLWIGLVALCVGALIPPVYRLCCAPTEGENGNDGGDRAEKKEGER